MLIKGKCQIQKLKFSVLNTFLCIHTFLMGLFNQSSCSDRQFMAKPINCEQISLLLTKKKYLFYHKLESLLNDCFLML